MADVTSKYEVELSVEEQQTLNNGGSVPIELPGAKVELTAASGGSLSGAGVPQRGDDVEVDDDASLEDLEQEVRKAQQEDPQVELEGGGGAPDTGMIEKNPDQPGN